MNQNDGIDQEDTQEEGVQENALGGANLPEGTPSDIEGAKKRMRFISLISLIAIATFAFIYLFNSFGSSDNAANKPAKDSENPAKDSENPAKDSEKPAEDAENSKETGIIETAKNKWNKIKGEQRAAFLSGVAVGAGSFTGAGKLFKVIKARSFNLFKPFKSKVPANNLLKM